MQLEQINQKIEKTQLVQLRLLGAKIDPFDLKNGLMTGYRINTSRTYFLLRYPFRDSFVFPCMLERKYENINQVFQPLFSTVNPMFDGFQTEIRRLEQLPKLPKNILTNYNRRTDAVFKKIKETLNGTTDTV